MKRCLTVWLLTAATMAATAADHGVILMYHHVDANTPAATSVTPAQFRRHLDFIEDSGFKVLPLHDLLAGVYGGEGVPDNAVAITFDDAYESVHREALPELESRNMPFTVFVATRAVDRGYAGSLSWAQLREMKASGLVTFGAHSVTHDHLLRGSEQGASEAWVARVGAEIDASVARLERQLPDVAVRSFAYPFGEFSETLADLVTRRELYGLGQQSGAVGVTTPRGAIPRFPMATAYAATERLATALNARPLPVAQVEAGNALIAEGTELPETMSFHLPKQTRYRRDQLACYSTAGKPLTVTRESDRFSVALPPLRAGRNKINCTAPSAERAGEFFWYARQWILADTAGNWLEY